MDPREAKITGQYLRLYSCSTGYKMLNISSLKDLQFDLMIQGRVGYSSWHDQCLSLFDTVLDWAPLLTFWTPRHSLAESLTLGSFVDHMVA